MPDIESNTPTTPVEGAPAPAVASAPAPAAAESGGAVAAPQATDSAPAAGSESSDAGIAGVAPGKDEAATSPYAWNGELDALDSADWWKKDVPEQAREALLQGWQSKVKNLEGDYTRKTQELAEQRKSLETRQKEWEAEKAKLERYRLWADQGTPVNEQYRQEAEAAQKRAAELEAAKEKALEELKAQITQEWEGKYDPVSKENEALKARLQTMQEEWDSERNQFSEAVNESLGRWVLDKAPQLAEDENAEALEAFEAFIQMPHVGDPDTALRLTAQLHPGVAPRASVKVAPAVDVMNHDGSSILENTDPPAKEKDYEAIKAEMLKDTTMRRFSI